jgi:hypothetical protein
MNKATQRPSSGKHPRRKTRGSWMNRASSKIAMRSIPTPFVVKPFVEKSQPMSKEDAQAWADYHRSLSESNSWRDDK